MASLPPPLDGAISGLISEQALASERLGRLTDKVAASLLDANLFSIRLPREDGGLGGTGVDLFEATEEIARADGSAGWNMLISNAVSTFVHNGASTKACSEIFGNGPVACWATLLPKAKSVEVEGGFCVSGDFAWGSSSSLSRWVMVAEPLNDRDGQQWFRAHLLPKHDVDIREGSWDVMGLRATASIDYSIVGKFVPAYRTTRSVRDGRSSLLTRRWREKDSNHRSLSRAEGRKGLTSRHASQGRPSSRLHLAARAARWRSAPTSGLLAGSPRHIIVG